jgi:hypothetical protein
MIISTSIEAIDLMKFNQLSLAIIDVHNTNNSASDINQSAT